MTVLASETQLLGTRTATLPRVNLLPPEIAQRRAFRRVQLGLGAAVLASVAVVGALYVSASHGVTSAQSELSAAKSQQATLQRQVASYGSVTATYAAADLARQQLATAMGDEIRYSQLLTDLSLSIPSNVWITNLTFTQTPAGGTAPAAAGTTAPLAGLGTGTFQGVAFAHNDVATWLETLAKLKTYANPYFTNSIETLIGSRPVVNFSSTVDLAPGAQSHRYRPAGG